MNAEEQRAGIDIGFPGSGDRPSARYVSATAVHEEALENGRLIGLYWSASGQVQRENLTARLPGLDSLRRPLHSFELEIDGQSLHNHWEWKAACRREGGRPGTAEAVLELVHRVRPVTVRVVTRLDGTPVMARWLEIVNTGSKPAAMSRVCPWSGVLWNTAVDRGHAAQCGRINPTFLAAGGPRFSVCYFREEDWGLEGDLAWQPLPRDTFRIERGAVGRPHNPPYYILKNHETGELFFLAMAWSGNYEAEFTNRYDPLLSFRLGPLAPAPLRILAPGETVRSPEIHLGPLHCGIDGAVAAWHAHLRASVMPPRPEGRAMFTAAGRVVEQPGDWILREADIAAEMGVEAFMVDAGWYGGRFASWGEQRGDWNEGSWLPRGMAGIREHVHGRGMLFGFWQEPEAIARGSRLYAEHPEWTLRADGSRECAETLDLSRPEAARHVEESVLGTIRAFRPDFYKIDYNVQVGEGGQGLRDGYAESESYRHVETIHRIFDRVRREFPEVCLEDCAGGGGRLDLGMLARFHYMTESDWSVHPYAIRAINALTLFLPPETLCYYHNHIGHAHQTADLETHLRVTLFCTPIFVGFGAQNADRSTEYFRATRRAIALHKGFCRPVLAGGARVYHHTPFLGILERAEWCVLEYGTPDRKRSYAGLFRLGSDPEADRFVFRPRGLDPARTYAVVEDNAGSTYRATGRVLSRDGVPVLLEAPLTSELLLFDAVEGA